MRQNQSPPWGARGALQNRTDPQAGGEARRQRLWTGMERALLQVFSEVSCRLPDSPERGLLFASRFPGAEIEA